MEGAGQAAIARQVRQKLDLRKPWIRANISGSNLIKKIREMSEASTPLFPMAGAEKMMPQPVQRPV
jgi:hypothetical protein